MKTKLIYILFPVLILTILIPIVSSAQVSINFWKAVGSILQPINNSYKLKIPQLGGSGTKCIHVDNNGLFSTSTSDCGTGGSSFAWPFDVGSYSGQTVVSTSTPLRLLATNPYSLIASSSLINYASSTGLTVSGSAYFATDGAGRVGVGTTTPVYRLTIASSTALTDGAGIAQWVTRNAGGNLYFATTTIDGTATTSISALTINGTTGNVGINNTSPQGALDVAVALGEGIYFADKVGGSGSPVISAYSTSGSGHLYFSPKSEYTVFQSSASANSTMQIQNGGSGYSQVRLFGSSDNRIITNAGNLTITPNANTIFSSGLVGIGTTTPSTKLNIYTASSTAGTAQTSPFGRLQEMVIAGVWYMVETFDYYGHLITSGPTPTVSSCGTSPAIYGNDRNMRVYVGSVAATSCLVTFAKPYANPPICTASLEIGSAAFSITASSTASDLTIGGGTITSDVVAVHCEGIR